MNRDVLLQIRLTKDEREEIESLARLNGQSVSDCVRDLLTTKFESIDWWDEGHKAGELDLWNPPFHARPGHKDYDDWADGFAVGQGDDDNAVIGDE